MGFHPWLYNPRASPLRLWYPPSPGVRSGGPKTCLPPVRNGAATCSTAAVSASSRRRQKPPRPLHGPRDRELSSGRLPGRVRRASAAAVSNYGFSRLVRNPRHRVVGPRQPTRPHGDSGRPWLCPLHRPRPVLARAQAHEAAQCAPVGGVSEFSPSPLPRERRARLRDVR